MLSMVEPPCSSLSATTWPYTQCYVQAMDSHKLTDVEKQIHDMHGWGIETYYGESLEVLAGLQMHAGSNFL